MGLVSVQYLAYGCAALAFVGAIASIVDGGVVGVLGAVAAGAGAVGALLFYKYGYVVWPLITRLSNVVQVTDTGYEVPPAQDVVLKQAGSLYYATIFLGVRIYESTTEKTGEENMVYTEYFERAISSVKFVTKFCMMVYVKDVSKFRENIEAKYAEAQLRLQRERDKADPDILRIERYERESAMWKAQMDRLASGVRPMGVTAYVMTTGSGISREAAVAAARQQAGELRATVANALNVEVVHLTGEEMMRCFEWEFMIPSTSAELEQQMQ